MGFRVDTGGVVGHGVQHDDRAIGGCLTSGKPKRAILEPPGNHSTYGNPSTVRHSNKTRFAVEYNQCTVRALPKALLANRLTATDIGGYSQCHDIIQVPFSSSISAPIKFTYQAFEIAWRAPLKLRAALKRDRGRLTLLFETA